MKKIVHVIIGLNVGGAELMLKRLVLNSQVNGLYQHEVISLTDLGVIGKSLREAGIKIHTLHMKSAFSLIITFLKLKQLLARLKPDVVQTWMYHADFLGGLAAKSLNIDKIIWGIRTTDVTQGGSRLTVLLRNICAKLSYTIPTHIISAAHVSKDVHISVGYDASKMLVIPNGFELEKLVASEFDREKFRSDHNISAETILVGSVGRFNIVKNQRLFIEVAGRISKFNNNFKFLMVGRDNTWENTELVSWIDEFGLRDKFLLLGQRNDISKCFKAMDIFLLHSKTEGFPNVLAEAMYSNLVCVSTNVGDVGYLLEEEYIVKDSSEDFNIVIQKIINLDFQNLQLIRKKNSDKILNLYSIDVCISKYESVYLSC